MGGCSSVTYFAAWPAWKVRLVLLCCGLLITVAALPHASLKPPPSNPALFRDADLDKAVTLRVSAGENYYAAAASELREHGYPTAPAPVFRQPWLAWFLALLRTETVRTAAVFSLFAILGAQLYRELSRPQLAAGARVAAFAVMAAGICIAAMPLAAYVHEVWAAYLIAISLLTYRADRWGLTVVLGFIACLFRELALPYLAAMAAFALYERRWRELSAWTIAAVAFCGLFAAHLAAASAMHQPGDAVSAGWIHFEGLPFVIVSARWNLMLHFLPDPLVAAAVVAGLLGLAGWRDSRSSRAALTLGGYLAAFTIVGRPDTSHWGQLYTPLLAVGLVLAPAAVRDLVANAIAAPKGAVVGELSAESQE